MLLAFLCASQRHAYGLAKESLESESVNLILLLIYCHMTYTCREYHACHIPAKIPAADGDVATPLDLTHGRLLLSNYTFGGDINQGQLDFNHFLGISSHVSFGNFQPIKITNQE